MRILNIIALLAFILFFSWWATTEENKIKRTAETVSGSSPGLKDSCELTIKDISNTLKYVSASASKNSVCQITVNKPFLLWEKDNKEKSVQIKIENDTCHRNTVWGCIWKVNKDSLQKGENTENKYFPYMYENAYQVSYSASAGKFYFMKLPEKHMDSVYMPMNSDSHYKIEMAYDNHKMYVKANNQEIFVYKNIAKISPQGEFGVFLRSGSIKLYGINISDIFNKGNIQ